MLVYRIGLRLEAMTPSALPEKDIPPAISPDEAIDFRRVYELLGLRCKTAHTALSYARKGLIRAIRINARTIRYSKRSVVALIDGESAA